MRLFRRRENPGFRPVPEGKTCESKGTARANASARPRRGRPEAGPGPKPVPDRCAFMGSSAKKIDRAPLHPTKIQGCCKVLLDSLGLFFGPLFRLLFLHGLSRLLFHVFFGIRALAHD